MFVPVVPHTTVVNKTIVYSDTVLSLNDKGSNLKITTISNVEEFMLDDCLRIIFESNPNVIFNTVQYSKNDKKVYFYTDKEIDISKYIKQGQNTITFTSDEFYSNSARKGLRLYVELVKKDENEFIW